jgi:hypothetical protein
MTNQQHPITPPPELVQQWKRTAPHQSNEHEHYHYITLCAAQWGADQELEESVGWLIKNQNPRWADALRAARRPQPPSLKEQALEQLDGIATVFRASHGGNLVCDTIRRALEALPE